VWGTHVLALHVFARINVFHLKSTSNMHAHPQSMEESSPSHKWGSSEIGRLILLSLERLRTIRYADISSCIFHK